MFQLLSPLSFWPFTHLLSSYPSSLISNYKHTLLLKKYKQRNHPIIKSSHHKHAEDETIDRKTLSKGTNLTTAIHPLHIGKHKTQLLHKRIE